MAGPFSTTTLVPFSTAISNLGVAPQEKVDGYVTLAAALQKLLMSELFAPEDQLVTKPVKTELEKETDFSVPDKTPAALNFQAMLWRQAGVLTLKLASGYFAEDSWPLIVARDTSFVLIGSPQFTGETLNRLLQGNEYGPICHATVAYLLQFVQPQMSKKFAQRGLDQLSQEAFERDYRQLVSGAAGQWMKDSVVAIQSLDAAELEAVCTSIKNTEITTLLRAIHQQPPMSDNFESSGTVWFNVLKDDLRSWLSERR